MNPKNLKLSISNKICIQNQIWFVPPGETTESFSFPGWNDPNLFTIEQPIKIEYCSGNGAWIAAKASEDPSSNWIAIEKKLIRVRKIWSKLKNHHLKNLLIVYGEGYEVTKNYFPDQSISEIFINFPDPWPKRRHAKYRIIQSEFVREIERILKPKGLLTLVTDDVQFSDWSLQILQSCTSLSSYYSAPYFINDFPHYGTSYFEDLWRKKGKDIRYHQFYKR
jgi:tRNA (guanine-N7-)-methyltransferase